MTWIKFTPSAGLYARGWVAGLRVKAAGQVDRRAKLQALQAFAKAHPHIPMWPRKGQGLNVNALFQSEDDAMLFKLTWRD